jgi:hypothetical protein
MLTSHQGNAMSKELIEQVARQAAFIEQLEQTVLEFTRNEKRPTIAADVSGPWDRANPKVKTVFSLRLPEPLHAKLTWAAENLPNESMHSIALKAVEDRVDELLAKHYRP